MVWQVYTPQKMKVKESTLPSQEPSLNSTLQHTTDSKFRNSSTENVILYIDDPPKAFKKGV